MSLMHHPMSFVSENSFVCDGTKIWQFASVIRGAIIGADCNIGACAIVDGARIGDKCSVGHGAQLHPGLVAGNEVFFGPGCVVCNDPWPRVRKGDFDISRILSGEFVTVVIGNGASLGAGAIILPGVTIGDGAMVSAGAVATSSIPDGHLLKRDGDIVVIGRRQVARMREAKIQDMIGAEG